jgi:hypothetical protein
MRFRAKRTQNTPHNRGYCSSNALSANSVLRPAAININTLLSFTQINTDYALYTQNCESGSVFSGLPFFYPVFLPQN